jgi:hypothetical protein
LESPLFRRARIGVPFELEEMSAVFKELSLMLTPLVAWPFLLYDFYYWGALYLFLLSFSRLLLSIVRLLPPLFWMFKKLLLEP